MPPKKNGHQMDNPIFEILKDLNIAPSEDISQLFSDSKLIINKKHLLSLSIQKMTIEDAILKQDSNSKFIYTEETLKMVIDGSFISEKFSKKELLNIFGNQNSSLINLIIELKIFTKILIINDWRDFDPEFLNLIQREPICLTLLKNKSLKEEISVKYLVDEHGELCEEYLNYLDKCMEFMNWEKFKEDPGFIFEYELPTLQKIRAKFNMKKFLCHLLFCYDSFSTMEQIDNLICLNYDFIDWKLMKKIMDNYSSLEQENENQKRLWLKTTFETNSSYFSNKDIAKWIRDNETKYHHQGYSEIPEFHKFANHDPSIFEFFCIESLFVSQLVDYGKLVEYLEDDNIFTKSDYDKKIVSKMYQFILENRSNNSFKKIASNPQKTLFKMKANKLKEHMNSEFLSLPMEILLEFGKTIVKTSLKEILEADNWDDLADFHVKIRNKEIKLDELFGKKFKLKNDVLESFGSNKAFVRCCICLESENKKLYLFDICSHSICWTCFQNYLSSKGLSGNAIKIGNRIKINLTNDMPQLPCPTCRLETVSKKFIVLIELFC